MNTNQETFYEAAKSLVDIEASVKYISAEPMLGRIFFPAWIGQVLDWLIIGAQTNPLKLPRVEDVKELVEYCHKAVIPAFLKDNLGWPRITADGSEPFYKRDETGTWILRQEMPE